VKEGFTCTSTGGGDSVYSAFLVKRRGEGGGHVEVEKGARLQERRFRLEGRGNEVKAQWEKKHCYALGKGSHIHPSVRGERRCVNQRGWKQTKEKEKESHSLPFAKGTQMHLEQATSLFRRIGEKANSPKAQR